MPKRECELLIHRIQVAAGDVEGALEFLSASVAIMDISHDNSLKYASERNRLNRFDVDRLERLIAEDGEALRATYELSLYMVTRVRLAASANIGHAEILADVEAQLEKIQSIIEPLFQHDLLGD